jgi:hypothetical protein
VAALRRRVQNLAQPGALTNTGPSLMLSRRSAPSFLDRRDERGIDAVMIPAIAAVASRSGMRGVELR